MSGLKIGSKKVRFHVELPKRTMVSQFGFPLKEMFLSVLLTQ